jgi:MFS family permease
MAPFYIFTTFILTYGTVTLGLDYSRMLIYVVLAAVASMIAIPFWGHLSDRVGRRRLTAIGCLVMMVWPFVYFDLLDTRVASLVCLAILLAQPLHDIQYGPQAAVIAESFPSRLRYSGSSLGYQLASVTAGGPAPLIAVWLMKEYQSSTAVAIYLAVSALVSLIALWLLPDRSKADLESH